MEEVLFMAKDIPDNENAVYPSGRIVNPDLSPQELVAIVDEHNAIIGNAPRAVMRREGLIHRATYILVFSSDGRLFVQDRTTTKDIFPGYHDLAAGGVVVAGEDYEVSARRELEEELGITGVPLVFLFDFYGEYASQKVWGRAFSCISDGPFILQSEELTGGAFFEIHEVKELISKEPCTPDSVYVLERYLEMYRSSLKGVNGDKS
jgi:8-oxo-dGTP pyrophosphatase MutT (NUDIX family)